MVSLALIYVFAAFLFSTVYQDFSLSSSRNLDMMKCVSSIRVVFPGYNSVRRTRIDDGLACLAFKFREDTACVFMVPCVHLARVYANCVEHFVFFWTGEKGNRLELSVNESKCEGGGRVS